MDTNNSQFEKITDSDEKQNFFDALIYHKGEVQAIYSDGRKSILVPLELKANHLYVRTKDSNEKLTEEANLIINFQALKTQLFAKTRAYNIPGNHFVIETNVELFRLQRRENFRINLGPDVNINVHLHKMKTQSVKHKCKMKDLSLGGCLIELPAEEPLSVNAEVSGTTSSPQKIHFEFDGVVRHVHINSDTNTQLVGISFSRLLGGGLNELNKMVMDLYRKLFSKFS